MKWERNVKWLVGGIPCNDTYICSSCVNLCSCSTHFQPHVEILLICSYESILKTRWKGIARRLSSPDSKIICPDSSEKVCDAFCKFAYKITSSFQLCVFGRKHFSFSRRNIVRDIALSRSQHRNLRIMLYVLRVVCILAE